MPKREIKHPDKLVSTGSYSAGIQIDGRLFISGQGPLDLRTGEVVRGSIEDETQLTLSHIGTILETAGESVHDVETCTCHLADIRELDGLYLAYSQLISGVRPPRSTVQ